MMSIATKQGLVFIDPTNESLLSLVPACSCSFRCASCLIIPPASPEILRPAAGQTASLTSPRAYPSPPLTVRTELKIHFGSQGHQLGRKCANLDKFSHSRRS